MLVISLDEQGDFENIKAAESSEKAPAFIGGIIFDDNDFLHEYDVEKKRIDLYLRAVCQETKTRFPEDLHVNGKNHTSVRLTKQLLTNTLAEFLKTGSCYFTDNEFAESLAKLPQRKGKYYIFGYIQYATTVKEMSHNFTSILVRDNYASNLYIHMAEDVVGRIIFHNPVIEDVNKVRLKLATRRVVVDKYSKLEREYINLGYKEDQLHKKKGKSTFILTNADVYRTALDREMINSEQNRITIEEMGVKSIYYETDEHNYRMSFLYLADIICSILGFKPDRRTPDTLISDFKKKADIYTGHEDNIIFAYDEIDFILKKAWNAIEHKDYYSALKLIYQGKKSNSPYTAYYTRFWFQRLRKRIVQSRDAAAFNIAVRKFYLSTLCNDLIQDELIETYETFESMLSNISFQNEEEKASLYELYDAGTTAFCHIGDSVQANKCFQNCKENAKYVGIERYLRTRNKMVVYLTDSFCFEKAYEIAQENIIFQEELQSVSELVLDKSDFSRNYGIALSQLGQIQASLHKSEGENVFLKALEQMGSESSPDYLQTESYLLHYYIEMGEKEKYDALVKKYFGGNSSLSKQLSFLIHEGSKGEKARFSMKFALYVYIKGLYRFHLHDISDSLFEKLYDIETTILQIGGENAVKQINNHPWEIIYKYLALIAYKNGKIQIGDNYINNTRKVLSYHGFTLDAICLFGEWEYAHESNNSYHKEECMRNFKALFYERNSTLLINIKPEDEETTYKFVKESLINYMYS